LTITLFVETSSVAYGGELDDLITVEVISKANPDRMRFVNEIMMQESKKNRHHVPDTIDMMRDFSNLQSQYFMKHHVALAKQAPPCPVYNCFLGFEDKKFKPYLEKFNTAAIKDKQLILYTLQKDPNTARRIAAIGLIGHFNNPREIIQVLLPYVTDPYPLIRNYAMRVMCSTMAKAKINNIYPLTFIDLLDSPYNIDRNKALGVLAEIVNRPVAAKIVK